MADGEYCILWNNYHEALVNTLCALQREGDMTDVTVVCGDGSRVKAHQVILAACSTFFRDFLRENPSKHPIILLPMEIHYPELRAMVEFMYTGQVSVSQDRLQSFMRGARYLRIRGVEDTTEASFRDETQATHVFNRDYFDGNKGEAENSSIHVTGEQSPKSKTSESGSSKDQRYTQWAECQKCHSKNALHYRESPSMKYVCAVCSAPGKSSKAREEQVSTLTIGEQPSEAESRHKEKDLGRKKRKIQITTRLQESIEDGLLKGMQLKKIKLEPEEQELIELTIGEDMTHIEPQQNTRSHDKKPKHATVTIGREQQSSDVTTVTVKKQRRSEVSTKDKGREFYGSITVKPEPQKDTNVTGTTADDSQAYDYEV